MSTEIKNKEVLKGGEFLIKESEANKTFIKTDIGEEQKMFAQMVSDFIDQKVLPNVADIDKGNYDLVEKLLEEAGELGILGAAIPQKYGGMEVDFNTESVMNEEIGRSHSYSVALAAHTGIGTLPILYYGTEEQKQKYIPKLASGELKAAYCLTEPDSGSDALAAKTRADLTEDGTHYIINGQKMWITNGGFADVFTVFAQIDGNKFTGFIIDADTEGISLGAEEEKMGIKGSSTRQVFFENVKIPKENVLGKIGEGHMIAFNVLNIGRYKLCLLTMGGAKHSISLATNYSNERKQFKVPISSFGAIKHKLAKMATKVFVCEAATYRTSGLINDMIESLKESGVDPAMAKLKAAEEYSIECALLKVFGSEVLDFVVDEAVQIYGGTGFSEEYPVARAYRDSRINRIFEGTNEINRLLSIGMLTKKAFKGHLDLMTPALAVQQELLSVPSFGTNGSDGILDKQKEYIQGAKKAFLLVSGAALKKFNKELKEQQEIIMFAADVLMEIYVCESALLTVEKMIQKSGEEANSLYIDMVKTYISDAMDRINMHGKHAICGFGEGDELKMMLMGLKRFTKTEPFNTILARRRVAEKMIAENKYCF